MSYINKIIFFVLILPILLCLHIYDANANANANANGLSIHNNSLYLNNKRWYPKGVSIVSFETPLFNKYKPTHKFDIDEIYEIKKFGANLVRISVSQGGLDSQSKIYSRHYVENIIRAIKLARSHHLIVIIDMQWQSYSDSAYEGGVPTVTTYRAWQSLLKYVKDDPGVMLELFNEPEPSANFQHWLKWQKYFNELIFSVRREGSNNIFLIDGLNWATTFSGMPKIHDPKNKLVYAIHPYLADDDLKSFIWNKRYGFFSKSHPVIATEFMAWSYPGGPCVNELPTITKKLLIYLRNKNIGIVAWAFDFDNLRSSNGVYTSFNDYMCPAKHIEGAGELIHSYFDHRVFK